MGIMFTKYKNKNLKVKFLFLYSTLVPISSINLIMFL